MSRSGSELGCSPDTVEVVRGGWRPRSEPFSRAPLACCIMYPCAPSCSCSSWLLRPRCSTKPFHKIFLSLQQPDSTGVFPQMFSDSHLVDLLRLDRFMKTAVHGINFHIRVWGDLSSIWKNSWRASQLLETALWNKCWRSECVTQWVRLVTYVWLLYLLYPAAFLCFFMFFLICCFFSTVAFFVSSKVCYFLNFIIFEASMHGPPPPPHPPWV